MNLFGLAVALIAMAFVFLSAIIYRFDHINTVFSTMLVVWVACGTAGFVGRRKTFYDVFHGLLGRFEPLMARTIEISAYAVAAYGFGRLHADRLGFLMPDRLLQPTTWSMVAILLLASFALLIFANRYDGPLGEVLKSAAVSPFVAICYLILRDLGTVYHQDWMMAGGWHLFIPVVVAALIASRFRDPPLDPYFGANPEEAAALRRFRYLTIAEGGFFKSLLLPPDAGRVGDL